MRPGASVLLLVGLVLVAIAVWRYRVEGARVAQRVPTSAEILSIEVAEESSGLAGASTGAFGLRGRVRFEIGGAAHEVAVEPAVWDGDYEWYAPRADELLTPGRHDIAVDPAAPETNLALRFEDRFGDHILLAILSVIGGALAVFGTIGLLGSVLPIRGGFIALGFLLFGTISLLLTIPAFAQTIKKSRWPRVPTRVERGDVVYQENSDKDVRWPYQFAPRLWLSYDGPDRRYQTPLVVGVWHGGTNAQLAAEKDLRRRIDGAPPYVQYNAANPYEISTGPGWGTAFIAPGLGILFLACWALVRRLVG